MNPFSRAKSSRLAGDHFDESNEFVAEHNPDPGPFLEGHDLLTDDDHVAFHAQTRELFERRGVYDVTFGYNLAELNLDRRHPDAGYRYAVDATDPAVLRAEFTPTTAFCPQAGTLAKASFRAWNGLADEHAYDLVRVRVHPMHSQSASLERALEAVERSFLESGTFENADASPTAGNADASPAAGNAGEPSEESPF